MGIYAYVVLFVQANLKLPMYKVVLLLDVFKEIEEVYADYKFEF
ncbi:MAG: hypothetical protein R2790_01490 [Flavobacterium haoranii]